MARQRRRHPTAHVGWEEQARRRRMRDIKHAAGLARKRHGAPQQRSERVEGGRCCGSGTHRAGVKSRGFRRRRHVAYRGGALDARNLRVGEMEAGSHHGSRVWVKTHARIHDRSASEPRQRGRGQTVFDCAAGRGRCMRRANAEARGLCIIVLACAALLVLRRALHQRPGQRRFRVGIRARPTRQKQRKALAVGDAVRRLDAERAAACVRHEQHLQQRC